MHFDLRPRTIFLALSGSRAYGTSTPTSDFDLRGIAVAPLEAYTGLLYTFEQFQGKLDWPEIPEAARNTEDVQVYDIRKFCQLAVVANPNILELLFVPDDCIIIDTPWMQKLREARGAFLSKKARHSFAGYAAAQMKRIRGHRRWLLDPPTEQPKRSDFELPEFSPIPPDQWRAASAMVDRQIAEWDFHPDEEIPVTVITRQRERTKDMLATVLSTLGRTEDSDGAMLVAAAKKLGMDDNFLELLVREKRYRAAAAEWKQYETWKKERNPDRAKLEANFGFDAKHASHLVRLMRSCEELMTKGTLSVRRPDAQELLAVRNGAWTFEQLEDFFVTQDKRMGEIYNDPKCPLPHAPDKERVSKLCSEIIETFGEHLNA